ncbi:MAG: hypothetical protein DWQ10_08440 [Calditrichaeota bacterium]|nr:MAG: hypothetical protein DWQ10_08440 [Calditrichota bacterium]
MNFLKVLSSKYQQISFLFLLCASFFVACATPQKKEIPARAEPPIDHVIQKTYVESVDVDPDHHGNDELKLIIRGQLPSPAYTFDVVDVVKDERNIYLTPFAVYQEKTTALQVLIPYQTSVIVHVDSPGEYKLFLIGRSATLRKNITIR